MTTNRKRIRTRSRPDTESRNPVDAVGVSRRGRTLQTMNANQWPSTSEEPLNPAL